MTSMTLGKRRRRQGFPVLQIISIIAILLSVSLFVYYLVRFSQQEERLASDVSVAGVPVGGLSAREAMSQLVTAYQQPVVLYYAESPILLDPSQIGFRVNAESMLASASAAGDLSGSFWGRFINFMLGRSDVERVNVPLSAEYQQTLLEQMLNDISRRYDRLSGEASYDLTTLTLRPGAAGFSLDKEAALRLIDEALRRPINRVVNLPFVESGINIGNIGTLKTMIEDYLDSKGFIFDGQTTIASVYILDLRTGEEVNINGDVAFSAASTIKVPILVDYYRHLWVSPTQDEAWLMANSLLCSNNSSSNLLMQITGERINTLNNTNTGDADTNLFTGLADVNRTIQYAGAVNTFITAPLYLGVQGQTLGSIPAPQTSPNSNLRTNADPYNQITAEDIGTIFNMIYDCANYGSGLMTAYPDGEFTQLECKQMI